MYDLRRNTLNLRSGSRKVGARPRDNLRYWRYLRSSPPFRIRHRYLLVGGSNGGAPITPPPETVVESTHKRHLYRRSSVRDMSMSVIVCGKIRPRWPTALASAPIACMGEATTQKGRPGRFDGDVPFVCLKQECCQRVASTQMPRAFLMIEATGVSAASSAL